MFYCELLRKSSIKRRTSVYEAGLKGSVWFPCVNLEAVFSRACAGKKSIESTPFQTF